MFKYQFQAIVYAQFYNRKDGFDVTLKDGSTARYNGNILASPNQFYFKVTYIFIKGALLVSDVLNGSDWICDSYNFSNCTLVHQQSKTNSFITPSVI